MIKENKYFIYDKQSFSVIKWRLYNIVSTFMAMYYQLKIMFIKPKIKSKKYNVSICAIFKNEAPYLKEWIEFNNIVGIEHFYLYNNNSKDDYMSVLKPYIKSGIVTLLEWPYKQKQMECYIDCIEKYAFETKWLGFIDIDEFIVPKKTNTIYEFLKTFEKRAGAVNIYWRLFGSSGMLNRKLSGFVSEDFTVCWPKYCDIGKCFYNTAFDFNKTSKHSKYLHHNFWASYKGVDIPPINIFNKICIGNRNIANTSDFPIQINHYFTKSYEEYAVKRTRGDVYFKINPHDEEYFYEHEMKCTDVDYSAYKYLIKLKSKIRSIPV